MKPLFTRTHPPVSIIIQVSVSLYQSVFVIVKGKEMNIFTKKMNYTAKNLLVHPVKSLWPHELCNMQNMCNIGHTKAIIRR